MPINIQEIVETGREVLGSSCTMESAFAMADSVNFVGQGRYLIKRQQCIDSTFVFMKDRNLDPAHFWQLTVDEVQLMIDVEGPLINAIQTKFSAEAEIELIDDQAKKLFGGKDIGN